MSTWDYAALYLDCKHSIQREIPISSSFRYSSLIDVYINLYFSEWHFPLYFQLKTSWKSYLISDFDQSFLIVYIHQQSPPKGSRGDERGQMPRGPDFWSGRSGRLNLFLFCYTKLLVICEADRKKKTIVLSTNKNIFSF